MNTRCALVVRVFRDVVAPILTAALLAGRQIDSWPRQVPFMLLPSLKMWEYSTLQENWRNITVVLVSLKMWEYSTLHQKWRNITLQQYA